jgi:hypothetical protein
VKQTIKNCFSSSFLFCDYTLSTVDDIIIILLLIKTLTLLYFVSDNTFIFHSKKFLRPIQLTVVRHFSSSVLTGTP